MHLSFTLSFHKNGIGSKTNLYSKREQKSQNLPPLKITASYYALGLCAMLQTEPKKCTLRNQAP
ncbi:hypothetical protein CDOMF_1775 [Campylobacter sp. RM16187]|nr:hypothetical protein CDOMF_1775 [Campylobacter sp. RM16187]